MLGICLGLQLLMDVGYEDGTHRGLGLIGGECVRFTVNAPPYNLKVPHMGWNSLAWEGEAPVLFKGLPKNPYVYFVHSYHVVPTDTTRDRRDGGLRRTLRGGDCPRQHHGHAISPGKKPGSRRARS